MTGLREGFCWIKLGIGFIIAFMGAALIGFGKIEQRDDYNVVERVVFDLTPVGGLLIAIGALFLFFGVAPFLVDLFRKAKCDIAKNTDPDAD